MGDDHRVTFATEAADTVVSQQLQAAFFAEIGSRYPGWEPGHSQSAEASDFSPPAGAWIVAYLDGVAVGCGGIKGSGNGIAEIRRVFLNAYARGHGIGRALLLELETQADRLGFERCRLTTGDRQPEALSLFRSAGFVEISAFNNNVFSRHWMEKRL